MSRKPGFFLSTVMVSIYFLMLQTIHGMDEVSTSATEPPKLSEMQLEISPVARGYEAIYERFLAGALIYRPKRGSDVGMITLPIRKLGNPLEGTFDLSWFGDAGKKLAISTGYRKSKKPENVDKGEIWIAPRFLIERELNTTAAHFKPIMGSWKQEEAPVGVFWTWGSWDNLSDYDYLTTESMDVISGVSLTVLRMQRDTTSNCSLFSATYLYWLQGVTDFFEFRL